MFTAKRNKAQQSMDLLKHKQYIQHAELIAENNKQRQAKEQLRVDTEYHHKEAQKQKDTAPPQRDTPPLMHPRLTVSAITAQTDNEQPGSTRQHASPAEMEATTRGQNALSPGSLENLFADFVPPVNGRSVHEGH